MRAQLKQRVLERLLRGGYHDRFPKKVEQFGSYGGGNHFGEAEVVSLTDRAVKSVW